jgi:hypothetical protein
MLSGWFETPVSASQDVKKHWVAAKKDWRRMLTGEWMDRLLS